MYTYRQLKSIGFQHHENHWRAVNHWHSKEKVYIVGGQRGFFAENTGRPRVLIRGRYVFFVPYKKYCQLADLRRNYADSYHKRYFDMLWSCYKMPLFSESNYSLQQLKALLTEIEAGHHAQFFAL